MGPPASRMGLTGGRRFTTEFADGAETWSWLAVGGTPPLFLRKNVILGELRVENVQECDSKEFAGLGATFTKQSSISYTSCQ